MGAFGEPVYTAHQIVVTHGGVITFAVGAWTRLPIDALSYARFNGPSGSITELREDDYFHNRQVVRLGDTRHLEPANTPLG